MRLHPDVAVRPEPFGALAYHYGNRKLVFLKDPELVSLIQNLDDASTLETAVNAFPEPRRHAIRTALERLEASDMVIDD
ncbi:MAG: mycofactocin biosynthesis chaperone MftB [Acidimicrobiia bacterium]